MDLIDPTVGSFFFVRLCKMSRASAFTKLLARGQYTEVNYMHNLKMKTEIQK